MFPGKELPLIPAGELDYREDGSSRLGDGAFGIVYRGRWRGNQVAIKALKMSALTSKAEEDFLQEMAVHSQLRHPNVVILYGAVTDKKPQLMVLELLTGSLYKLLHSETVLPWEERLRIGEEIGQGLDYLHSKQIIHRDLKSLNVLLDEKQCAKLADFGLATLKTETISQSRAQAANGQGTLPWMAPELFDPEGQHSMASDMYAYGTVLWELASRKIPFAQAAAPQLVMVWVTTGKREKIPDDTPSVLREVIQGCWVAEPKARPELSAILTQLQVARGRPASPVEVLTATFAGNLGSVGAGSASASAATFAGNLGSVVGSMPSPAKVLAPGEASYREGVDNYLLSQFRKAKECFESSAAKGYPGSYLYLWNLYFDNNASIGSSRNLLEAEYWKQKVADHIKWFQDQAATGQAEAQHNLGWCYENGIGVAKDEREAVKWYRQAADQGFVLAQNNLGYCYYQGNGTAKDGRDAVKWFRQAAEQGFGPAQCNLGYCYYLGNGVAKDERQAVKWFQQAAKQEFVVAQNNLAQCYMYGRGVSRDEGEAVRLYQKGVEQGCASAQHNLGCCYARGQGVAQNMREAVRWLRKAAEQGLTEAQSELAILLQQHPHLK